MNDDFSVSIVVCTYNRAEQLSGVINDLRCQNYTNADYEIIIVDNGSTDETKSVVDRFINLEGIKVRYCCESQRGVTYARNRGMEMGRYPYLAYLDDDCSVNPDWLKSLMTGYQLDHRVFAVFGQIVNDWRGQTKPDWVIPETEIWLGNNGFLGTQARVLESGYGIREGNLSIKKSVLQKYGGFLGMEQFGSKNMAAAELKYCLWKANQDGEKIAYMPAAVAYHHVVIRSRSWMVKRAYWQGISDGIFDYLISKRHFLNSIIRALYDLAAMIGLFLYSSFFLVQHKQSKWLFHLLRTTRRVGLILSELRLQGNWSQVYNWAHNRDRSS